MSLCSFFASRLRVVSLIALGSAIRKAPAVTRKLKFVIALHNHQPVGNFDHVFEHAHAHSYKPMLDAFERFGEIKFCLHYSGVLLEWIQEHHPETFDQLRRMVASGQLELIGGGMYEPILVMLGDADRHGQLRMQSDYQKEHFGAEPAGGWLTERVWEQGLVAGLADAGLRYTAVDDSHFKFAGLPPQQMAGYFVTEDRGRTLAVFPMDEFLRYSIPFKSVEENIDYLRGLYEDENAQVVCYGDDGEKFGVWPGTYKHCFEEGWLWRFLEALRDNSEWLETVTGADAVETTKPLGRVYLPDASYREMMEWALPTPTHIRHTQFLKDVKEKGLFEEGRYFIRGSVWRQFRQRYAEASEMYSRMMTVSRRLETLKASEADKAAIRRELYQGQCNCPYWHGVFGGLYLAHLRFAIYKHLILADNMIDRKRRKSDAYVDVEQADFDFDDRPEIELSNAKIAAFLKPDRGGHLYELDVREIASNVTATLTRVREEYHHRMLEGDAEQSGEDGEPKSIHESIVLKDPTLREKVVFDPYKRESLIDHLLPREADFESFKKGTHLELADFTTGEYAASVRKKRDKVLANLSRTAQVHGGPEPMSLELTKTVALGKAADGLEVTYRLANLSEHTIDAQFAVENHAALLAGDAPDRYYFDPTAGVNLGPLIGELQLDGLPEFDIIDEWQRLRMRLVFGEPASLWTFPINTVSQSEGGLELTYQGSVILARWPLALEPGQTWQTTVMVLAEMLK